MAQQENQQNIQEGGHLTEGLYMQTATTSWMTDEKDTSHEESYPHIQIMTQFSFFDDLFPFSFSSCAILCKSGVCVIFLTSYPNQFIYDMNYSFF